MGECLYILLHVRNLSNVSSFDNILTVISKIEIIALWITSEHDYNLRLCIVCHFLPWALFQRNEILKMKNYLMCSYHQKRVHYDQVSKRIFHERKIAFLQFSRMLSLFFRWKQIEEILGRVLFEANFNCCSY